MYSLCGNIRSNYYLKVRDVQVQLISCLPDSNKNSAREFVRVAAIGLPMSSLTHFHRGMLVDTEHFYLL